MAENVKGLSIKLGLDTTALQQGVNQVQKNIKKLNSLQKTFNKISAGILGVGTAIIATATKVSSAINDMEDSATEAGVGFEQWQKLSFSMDQIGISTSTTSSAMAKMNTAIGKVADGSGKNLIKILKELGINQEDFVKMTSDEAFYALNDALGNVTDNATKLSYMSEFFGDKLTTKLLPAVEQGSQALKEMGEQAVIFTDEQAVASKKTETLQKQISQTATVIGASLLPIVNEILTKVKSFVEKIAPKIQGFFDKIANLSEGAKRIIGVLSGVGVALAPILKIGTSIYKLVGVSLPKALTLLSTHPIIAGIGVAVGLLATLYSTSEDFKKTIDELIKSVGELLTPLLKIVGEVLEPMVEMFSGVLGSFLKLIGTLLTPLARILNDLLKALKPLFDFLEATIIPVLNAIVTALRFITFGGLDALMKALDGDWSGSSNEGTYDKSEADAEFERESEKIMNGPFVAPRFANRNRSSENATTKNYYITINTSADHMSIDELDSKLGLAS